MTRFLPRTRNKSEAQSQIDAGLRRHGFLRLAGAAGRSYHPGHTGVSYWTINRGKGLAAGLRTNRCRRACPGPGGVLCTASSVPTENFLKALNDILPASIRVLEVSEVPPNFMRESRPGRRRIVTGFYREPVCPPFLARYVWHFPYPLDEEAMARAAGVVVGEHDFTSFAAVDPERDRPETPRTEGHEGKPTRLLQCANDFFFFMGAARRTN